jgi:predicted metalloprotease
MQLGDGRESSNIEDRRGGGMGVGTVGIGTVVVALIASYFFGIDPTQLLNMAEQAQAPTRQSQPLDPATDPERELRREVSQVLAKTEDTWNELFRQMNAQYQPPTLVLFRGATPTACGTGRSAMGPFYCPGDQKVYLDMSFFSDLQRRFRAAGDFARAYVIAHEIGHHVQNLTGISKKTDALRSRMSETQYNRVSVRVELQADCFAGVWAHHANRAKPFIEAGDIDEALNAASAIGDDRLQQQSGGSVVPDSFTHGSSAQRVRWFKTGFEAGDMKACDTFAAKQV